MTQPDDPLNNSEQALIGALLMAPHLAEEITTIITPTDLHNPHHETIYRTLLAVIPLAPPGPLDPLLLARALAATGNLKPQHGGANYLHTCLSACTNPLSATTYAHTIREAANNRTITTIAAALTQTTTMDAVGQHTRLLALRAELDATITNTRGLNGRHPNLTPAHLYRIKAMNWLWDNRIPLGTLTLISGREGVGKSIFLAWLTAAITNGNLPGRCHGQRRSVLIGASEDSWEYTITPRLLAAGADLDLVYRLDIEETDGTHTPLNLPHDLHHIGAAAEQTQAAALLLDPLLSVLDDDINVFKAREVRTVLEPLTAAAEAAGIAVVGLVHYNKARHGDSNSMIANSRAFVEVARTVIAIARDDDADDYTCVLTQTKNNVGPLDLPSLLYTIDDVTLETEDGENAHVGRLRWTGEAEVTADQLLTGTAGDRPLNDTGQAILDWITNAAPPVTVQEVAAHFKDSIKYETVKKTMARLAAKGHLLSPSRGLYETPGSSGRKRGKRPGRSGTPLYPRQNLSLVPTTPPNQIYIEVVGGVIEDQQVEEGVPKGVPRDKEVSLRQDQGMSEMPEDRGTRDKVTSPARGVPLPSPQPGTTPVPEPPDEDEPEPWWHR